MSTSVPPPLSKLLAATDGAAREGAWSAFLDEYSQLLMRTARRASPEGDEAMDHYVYILDRLADDEYRRLRGFATSGSAKFTTWLVVVARRLCVDNHRRIHGRPQGNGEDPRVAVERTARKNLIDQMAGVLDVEEIHDDRSLPADSQLELSERHHALRSGIEALSVADRLLLTLRFEDGHTPEKIAFMVGLPTRFHVYRRLKRALGELRAHLERHGITGP